MTSAQTLVKQLRAIPAFSNFDARNMAQIAPYIVEKTLQPNETLFTAGNPATDLYLIQAGQVSLFADDRKVSEVHSGCIGEESVIGAEFYSASAIADSHLVVLVIPQAPLKKLLRDNPKILKDFYSSLLNHHTGGKFQWIKSEIIKPVEKRFSLQSFGWLACIVVPILIILFTLKMELGWDTKLFTIIFSVTLIMWVFNLVAEFIPGIFSILAILILGIAPPSVVLSGFASDEFFMAMSLFGLGSVLVTSGLTYRFILTILKLVPNNHLNHSLTIFLTGAFLTPLLPSANGRVKIIGPVVSDMIEILGFKPGSKASTGLCFDAFAGISLLSSAFLSSKSANFIIAGLLPDQVREQFNWGYWAIASLVSMVFMMACHLLISTVLFHNQERHTLSKQNLSMQIELIGPMNKVEWAALAIVFLFFFAVITSPVHKIALPWIGLMILFLLLSLEILNKRDFQHNIDWSFLVLLGCLVGISKSISYIGLDQLIADNLGWLNTYMKSSFMLFILLLSIVIMLSRFFLPNTTCAAIFATVFMPISELNGFSPWVLGLIILTISDAWIFPYQCSYYLLFREEINRGKAMFNEKSMVAANLLMNVVRFLAIYASIPYWKLLGIL